MHSRFLNTFLELIDSRERALEEVRKRCEIASPEMLVSADFQRLILVLFRLELQLKDLRILLKMATDGDL